MNSITSILKLLNKIDYIDMHIHMDECSSDDVYENILYFANSIDEESYKKTLKLAGKSQFIIPLCGIHPVKAGACDISPEKIEKMMIANDFIGEIGIDNFWIEDRSTYVKQKEIFETQLDIISRHKMIPSIHTKGAEKTVLGLLKKFKIQKSIIHWYSGPLDLIEEFLEQGCYFTIGPDILSGSEIYLHLPMERILLETDNPTGMTWISGHKNRGDDIIRVYRQLSKKIPIEEKLLIKLVKENLLELMNHNP